MWRSRGHSRRVRQDGGCDRWSGSARLDLVVGASCPVCRVRRCGCWTPSAESAEPWCHARFNERLSVRSIRRTPTPSQGRSAIQSAVFVACRLDRDGERLCLRGLSVRSRLNLLIYEYHGTWRCHGFSPRLAIVHFPDTYMHFEMRWGFVLQ